MSNSVFYAKQENSLVRGWARAFVDAIEHPTRELAPFTMCVASESNSALELPDTATHPLVKALDACLEENGDQVVEKVAFPLFPERLWQICDGDRHEFYAEFLRNQPSYVSWEPRKNQGGIYFGRLVGFGVSHRDGKDLGFQASNTLSKDGNQLEHIIRQCKKAAERGRGVAQMQLQATTFDPYRDLTTSGQPSFPCLQHITFDPDIKSGNLAMNAFYATQKLFVKSFGNWLGLCRLGRFVAEQSGLKFTRFTCFAGVQKMDDAPKATELRVNLIEAAKEALVQNAGPLVVANVG